MKKILVVDDEPGHRMMLRAVLEDAGWEVFEAESAEEAFDLLDSAFVRNGFVESTQVDMPDVMILDIHLPGIDGHEALGKIHSLYPNLVVVMLTAFGSVGSAVEAMKKGAFDYLTKPSDNDELCAVLENALRYAQVLKVQNSQNLSSFSTEKEVLENLVGQSNTMKKLRELIRQAAPSEATVLILGESGTGKELIADALHALSERAEKPFIKINCAALPANLLESELFGYEKGAFTGAVRAKPGRFVLADGGSLFLDEIGELSLDLQAKLLRVLQERIVEPLGGVKGVPINVRIFAATNRDLRQEVKEGRFREDLYFRLNVIEIASPPLRERLDDLPELCAKILARLVQKNKKSVRGIEQEFMECLSKYSWSGNIRELENVLERALILSRGDNLSLGVLPEYILHPEPFETIIDPKENVLINNRIQNSSEFLAASQDASNFEKYKEEAEKQALSEALKNYDGHREKTADALGISRRTLQYKLKKYGLTKR
ncbi:sigma-54-dependent transcriptional regulator [Desulfovibrio litoralis]|uniref:Two-component system, NtrC family, response regulator n=1 Tax=Desulfovibrio litoralis DSM 11393 TaxID=1121455 RepID=A0A1M7SNX3_9BACT|nr:sigma-54 dependent transcriptional regulator [Desulfovibrio litoralis]SHN60118.1 two-component system, NtrC family, response regulator [Desulfovibrio litoralis DSM 11393]